MSSAPAHTGPGVGRDDRPLAGRRVVLTRPASQAGDFAARIAALGGMPIVAPAIAIAPPESWTAPDTALRRIETYDWIAFTSANAVRALADRSRDVGVPAEVLRRRRLAAVGTATANAIAGAIREPDVIASAGTGAVLAAELPDVRGRRVLFPHGDLAGDAFPATLEQRGASVDRVVVYRTVAGPSVEEIVDAVRAGTVDVLLFASASAVRFVADALAAAGLHDAESMRAPERSDWPAVICIGPRTADAAQHAGFRPVAVAESATLDDLIERVARWCADQRAEPPGAL